MFTQGNNNVNYLISFSENNNRMTWVDQVSNTVTVWDRTQSPHIDVEWLSDVMRITNSQENSIIDYIVRDPNFLSQLSEHFCVDESRIDPQAVCYLIYAPVCGCNGETYSNDCIAQSNGVYNYTQGACGG